MSNTFIGLTMLVTLSSPPGAQLRGVVSGIEPGKSLTLKNVTCPQNGKFVPEFEIDAAEIVELVEANEDNAPPVQHPGLQATPISRQSSAFEDPAILSMGKRPTPISRSIMPPQWSASDSDLRRVDSALTGTSREERPVYQDPVALAAAKMVESMQKIGMEEEEEYLDHVGQAHMVDEPEQMRFAPEVVAVKEEGTSRNRARRMNRKENRRNLAERAPQEPAASSPVVKTTPKRGKGWRETPLLTESFQPFNALNKKNGRRGKKDDSGWGTEDATDVQDMGDFDFEGGLAKFDKNTVFNQIQAEDSILDEDRLVYHNRLPKAKPGTAGGKNLHYTENVLDGPVNGTAAKENAWKSEAGDSDMEERRSQMGSGSGHLSRRANSKLSTNRRPTSRKGSSTLNNGAQRTMSIPIAAPKPSFFLVPSDRRCEPISALQMLNLETIADHELGLSEDMMTENAGRGIAEVAFSSLGSGGGLTQGKKSSLQNVVVLAGNNKSGIRAIAAARHIRNHGMHVTVCVLGLERESELLAALKRQIKVFRSFGGKIVSKNELFEYVKGLNAQVELVIDGLLGLTMSFEELRRGDQAAAYELIEWTNRGQAAVLAIDVPTGIDPSTGKVSIIDGRKLYIHAKYVVAMGAPQKGLLDAMALGEGVTDEDGVSAGGEWQLFVADIGLGAAAWKKAGTKIRKGVEFEGSWVVGMRFQSGAE